MPGPRYKLHMSHRQNFILMYGWKAISIVYLYATYRLVLSLSCCICNALLIDGNTPHTRLVFEQDVVHLPKPVRPAVEYKMDNVCEL